MNKIYYRTGYKYQLHKTYTVQTSLKPLEKDIIHGYAKLDVGGVLTVNEGYAWDGPSGPTIDSKNFMRGSLIHDVLYQLMREKHLDLGWREAADSELRKVCREDGMSWLRAWWVYKAVRLAGEGCAMWDKEKIIEAP